MLLHHVRMQILALMRLHAEWYLNTHVAHDMIMQLGCHNRDTFVERILKWWSHCESDRAEAAVQEG